MNISLIGMMGSGKTAIGKLLVFKMFGYSFIDTDDEIIRLKKCSINDIFEKYGENYFRELESKVLNDILKYQNQVISTGGGIILSDNNLSLLLDKSIVIYLAASAETLYERVKNSKERPLLNNTIDMKQKITSLLNKRLPIYNKAHFTITTDGKNPDIIVNEIIRELKEYG